MDVKALVSEAGFPETTPVVFAAHAFGQRFVGATGLWTSDRPVLSTDLFYTASLSKQVTGAAMAMLIRSGKIDPDVSIARDFLPKWADLPTPRQLLHHVGSLPQSGLLEETLRGKSWTSAYVLEKISDLSPPVSPPGTRYVYSNAGYIVLATIMERATRQSFPEIAALLLPPLAATQMVFATVETPVISPQVPRLGPSQPLSLGDGGLWSTAVSYAEFLDLQNEDAFGTSSLTQSDMDLPSGGSTGYGWGIGLRLFRGRRLFVHGGSWTGSNCKAVRCPDFQMSVVVLSASAEDKAVGKLVDALCHLLVPIRV